MSDEHGGAHDAGSDRGISVALVEAALEERLGGREPPDLTGAVMAAADARAVRRGSAWRWLAAAVALVACGAWFGLWWNGREDPSGRSTEPAPVGLPPSEGATGDEGDDADRASSAFYLPRDIADAQRILRQTDSVDVTFHFVGPHRLPTANSMGPPPPTLALGRWALGKAIAMGLASALDEPRPVPGVDADARAHTLFVPAEDKRMRLALLPRQPEGSVLWVESLGAFATDLAFAGRLQAVEHEARRQLGLVHRDELGHGLPNDLILNDQRILQPHGLFPEDVEKLRGLTKLEVLDLRWCDAGATVPFMEAISALATVRELRVAELTDATVAAIARLPLRRLSVVGASEAPWRSPLRASCAGLTDAGLDALLQLRELEDLALPGLGVSRQGLGRLAELRQLHTLVLTGARPEGRERFWQHFADHDQLSELGLAGSSLATVDDVFDLAKLPALEQLDLDGCLWLSWGIEPIGQFLRPNPRARLLPLRDCPRLRRLSLGGWFPEPLDGFDRNTFIIVAMTPSLRWLALTDCPGIGPTQYQALRDAKQLETLVLTGPIEPAALDPLDAIPGLTVVIESPQRGG